MDPNTLIDNLHDILIDQEGDSDDALTAILDLRQWFKIGGFAPDTAHVDRLAHLCQKMIEERP